MRLYENSPDNYSEMKGYYPVWYWDVLEMSAIWKSAGQQLDDLRAGIVQAVDNNFVSTADARTLTILEEFLYIPYDGPRTVEERRALISAFFLGNGHIGEKELTEIVAVFTSGEIAVELIGGTIEISVTREISDQFNLSNCLFIVGKRIPAHLAIIFRDILLPIRFVTRESLYHHDFYVKMRFFNGGNTDVIMLGGQKRLNGTWNLNQIFRGVALAAFSMLVSLSEKNKLHAQTLSLSPISICNSNELVFSVFCISVRLQNRGGLQLLETGFVGAIATQTYSLRGHLVMDSLYTLNGNVLLNGSRKLNAQRKEEDI